MKLGPEVLILSETINKLYHCEKIKHMGNIYLYLMIKVHYSYLTLIFLFEQSNILNPI